MDFSAALDNLKKGRKIARSGWNGKGMWIHIHKSQLSHERDYIEMKDVQDLFVPWFASQTDILALDWEAVE